MINLNILNQQHGRIKEELNYLEAETKKGDKSMNTSELVLHINRLAGQLRIHLLEEDKFLYPNLLNCHDEEIRKLAHQYMKEMGDLTNQYTSFKNNYNTVNKIIGNESKFLSEVKIIMKALKDRIAKEDNNLYYLIKLKEL
ncbi:MAG TPA: hemerythrin domain-containing protein [Clostridiales bacterium]|nr:hemerythrin domain-containing protein [Clostridiales bacterium]